MLVIIYQLQNITWDFDINTLRSSENDKIVLVTTDEVYKNCFLPFKNYFDKIIAFKSPKKIFIETNGKDRHRLNKLKFDSFLFATKEIIKKFQATKKMNIRIITCDETTVTLCAKLRDVLKIPGDSESLVNTFINKAIIKQKIQSIIRCPSHIILNKKISPHINREQIELKLGKYPYVAKPVDSGGSNGVVVLNNRQDLDSWLDNVYKKTFNQVYEIDEFIEGKLYHCDILIIENRITFFDACEYSTPNHNYFLGRNLGSIKLLELSAEFQLLKKFSSGLIDAIDKFPNGFFHLECFIENNSGDVVFLEIAARPGGGLIPKLYKKIYGLNIIQTHFFAQLGLINNIPSQFQLLTYASCIKAPKKNGKIKSLNPPTLNCENEIHWYIKKGEIVEQDSDSLHDVAATVLLWDKKYLNVSNNFENLANYVFFRIDSFSDSKKNTPLFQRKKNNYLYSIKLILTGFLFKLPLLRKMLLKKFIVQL